jgi:hypothetical protein
MKPENWIAIGSAVLTGLITAAGLYLGPKFAVKRSLQQFRSEHWWKKQDETYTKLLEHLSVIQTDSGNYIESIEMQESYHPGEIQKARVHSAYNELEALTAQGSYLISEKAAEALRIFQHESWVGPDDDAHGGYSKTFDAAKKCIAVLTAEAKALLP